MHLLSRKNFFKKGEGNLDSRSRGINQLQWLRRSSGFEPGKRAHSPRTTLFCPKCHVLRFGLRYVPSIYMCPEFSCSISEGKHSVSAFPDFPIPTPTLTNQGEFRSMLCFRPNERVFYFFALFPLITTHSKNISSKA